MRLLSLFLFAAVSTAIAFCASGEDDPPKSPSASSFGGLFEQLADDDAERRESALKALQSKGLPAIEPALKVALSDQLESGIRAVMVLEALDESTDKRTAETAEKALLHLTTDGRPTVARRAQEALDRHILLRTIRAAREIHAFKGQIGNMPHQQQGFFLEDDEDLLPTVGLIDRNWKGGAEGLRQFVRADSVRTLYILKGHPVSQAAIAEFHKQHPQITLIERGAAFVGVGTGSHRFGCQIGTAVDDKPAAIAGLRPGDVVTRIGDYPIQSAEDLIKVVAEYQPGDVVRFVYLRDEVRYQLLFHIWEQNPEDFPLLFPNMLLQSMRREVDVKMGAWELISWREPRK